MYGSSILNCSSLGFLTWQVLKWERALFAICSLASQSTFLYWFTYEHRFNVIGGAHNGQNGPQKLESSRAHDTLSQPMLTIFVRSPSVKSLRILVRFRRISALEFSPEADQGAPPIRSHM